MPQGVEYKAGLPGHCSRLSLGATLSLLAVVLLAPTPARAGCGDHVAALHLSAPAASDSTPPPAQPFEKHAPCSGPNCSRSPVAPAPVPDAPPSPSVQEWACALAPSMASSKTSAPHAPEDHRQRPFSAGSSIYHPPR